MTSMFLIVYKQPELRLHVFSSVDSVSLPGKLEMKC